MKKLMISLTTSKLYDIDVTNPQDAYECVRDHYKELAGVYTRYEGISDEDMDKLEDVISKSSIHSYLYAKLTNKRFKKGEKAIAKTDLYMHNYKKLLSPSDLEELEKSLI